MDFSGALIRWIGGGVLVLSLIVTIYVMHLKNQNLTIEAENAKMVAGAYKRTLAAYQDQFALQARALGSEKGREIARQENLLKTLNLIGDFNETETGPISDAALAVIDSLYDAGPRNAAGPASP